MPMSAKHPCVVSGCPALVSRGARCPQHAKQYERARPSSLERGYDSRWSKAAKAFRNRHPLCGMKADGSIDKQNSWCAEAGLTTIAQCVQHIVPHKGPGDPLLMDQSNWMSSCFRCNNRRRASREPGAFGR